MLDDLKYYQAQQILSEHLDMPLRILRRDAIERVADLCPSSIRKYFLEMIGRRWPDDPSSEDIHPTLLEVLNPHLERARYELTNALWMTPPSGSNPLYDELRNSFPRLKATARLSYLRVVQYLRNTETKSTVSLQPLGELLEFFQSLPSTANYRSPGICTAGPYWMIPEEGKTQHGPRTRDKNTTSSRFVNLELQLAATIRYLEDLCGRKLGVQEKKSILIPSTARIAATTELIETKLSVLFKSVSRLQALSDKPDPPISGLSSTEWNRIVQWVVFWILEPISKPQSLKRGEELAATALLTPGEEGLRPLSIATYYTTETKVPKLDFTLRTAKPSEVPERINFNASLTFRHKEIAQLRYRAFIEEGRANRARQHYQILDRVRFRIEQMPFEQLPARAEYIARVARRLVMADVTIFFYINSTQDRLEAQKIWSAPWIGESNLPFLQQWLAQVAVTPTKRSQSAIYRCLDSRTEVGRFVVTEESWPFLEGQRPTIDHLPAEQEVWGAAVEDLIVVPVMFHERPLGVLYLASIAPLRFRYYDRVLLLSLIRAFEPELFEAHQIRALKEMNRLLHKALSESADKRQREKFYEGLMEVIAQLLAVQGAALWWRPSRDESKLRLFGASGEALRDVFPSRYVLLDGSREVTRLLDAPDRRPRPLKWGKDHRGEVLRERGLTETLFLPLYDDESDFSWGAITLHEKRSFSLSAELEEVLAFLSQELLQVMENFLEHRSTLEKIQRLIGHDLESVLKSIGNTGKRLEPFTMRISKGERESFLRKLKDLDKFVEMGRRLLDWLTMDSQQKEIDRSDNLMLSYYHYLGSEGRLTERTDILEVINTIFHNRLGELRSRGVGFKLVERHQFKVWVHEDALREVIMGLVDNLVKYAAPHSKVYVSFKETSLELMVGIRSRGICLHERLKDVPDRIFDEGIRGVKQGGGNPTGKGQGLFIARNIARSWGGDLKVEYADGDPYAAFVFTVHFPKWLEMEENPWSEK